MTFEDGSKVSEKIIFESVNVDNDKKMFDGTINYEKPLKNSGTVKANFKFVFSDNLREVKAEIEYTKGDGKTETKK